MLPNLGFGEILLLAAIVLVIFGAKRLPEAARSLGSSFNAFKKGLRETSDEATSAAKDPQVSGPKA
ncbi:MAG: twin-arginine translocase TatA/TatE family subunit [Elusimicrobia bacterium]|nr:twin-arginine translocase TatA/TatE family subunit [Elusimicrobiota bacterium]